MIFVDLEKWLGHVANMIGFQVSSSCTRSTSLVARGLSQRGWERPQALRRSSQLYIQLVRDSPAVEHWPGSDRQSVSIKLTNIGERMILDFAMCRRANGIPILSWHKEGIFILRMERGGPLDEETRVARSSRLVPS